ncbi:hypothetical protein [Methylomonas sp. HYX-M1]|uniref:hypothetical protein n=1 Tax=Methylomonas sp. HYX-M1 TaxID=3139307 RepID=UPI00345B5544
MSLPGAPKPSAVSLGFMDSFVAETLVDKKLPVILDNYCTYKNAMLGQHSIRTSTSRDLCQLAESGGNLVRYFAA